MPSGAGTETRAPTAACAPRETRARRGAARSRSSGARSTEGRSRAPCTRAPPPGPGRSARTGSARSPWRARRSRARRGARPSRSAAAAHRPARARRGTSRGDRARGMAGLTGGRARGSAKSFEDFRAWPRKSHVRKLRRTSLPRRSRSELSQPGCCSIECRKACTASR